MSSSAISQSVVVVVLVRRGFRYLLVRDDARGGLWYPPAGAMQAGEDLISTAQRITREASGMTPEITGVISINHMPRLPEGRAARWRYVLEGKLGMDSIAESTAGAATHYYLPGEVAQLELRGKEVVKLVRGHAQGRAVAPIEIYQVGLG